MYEIKDWNDISKNYTGTIILGNGASIAVNEKFNYTSLFEKAGLSTDIKQLFDFFKTKDFELILKSVWQAFNVNKFLKIKDDKTHDTYVNIRDCLIKTVSGIHPKHEAISTEIVKINSFLKIFDYVISLNYDLIVYWSTIHSLDKNGHAFKDGFCERHPPKENWEELEQPIKGQKKVSLVFYPHGNLMLCQKLFENGIGQDRKLCKKKEDKDLTQQDKKDLLQSVLEAWKSEDCVPLFVSEGTKEHKLRAIRSSNYLSIVYQEVLPNLKDNITIYGWGIEEQDEHILKKILENKGLKKIAVSVYDNDQDYCHKIEKSIKKIKNNIEIEFFDSKSPGCWNNEPI